MDAIELGVFHASLHIFLACELVGKCTLDGPSSACMYICVCVDNGPDQKTIFVLKTKYFYTKWDAGVSE